MQAGEGAVVDDYSWPPESERTLLSDCGDQSLRKVLLLDKGQLSVFAGAGASSIKWNKVQTHFNTVCV